MHDDFFFVDELVAGVRWDAEYATWDNFTGRPVDGYLVNRIVGSRALCPRPGAGPSSRRSLGFGLLLWDGYRPQRAVDCFLRWSRDPDDGRTKGRFYPNLERTEMVNEGYVAARSGHSRGAAVDLTLFHLDTDAIALMGGRPRSDGPGLPPRGRGDHPLEASNRRVLASIMEEHGFDRPECEWWHYTLCDEPHPTTYFDFPVA